MMVGDVTHRNQPVRELVEFTFFAQPVVGEENVFDLMAELRVERAEVDRCDIGDAFTVRLRRVVLSLDLSGANITPGSKLGEPIAANKFDVQRSVEKEFSSGAKASGEIGAEMAATKAVAKGSLGVSGRTEGSFKAVESSKTERSVLRVRAIGNDRWEIAEFDGSPVSGKVINNEPLCRLSRNAGSNAILVAGSILAKQRDFKFEYEGSLLSKLGVTDQKLLGIFLTKKLKNEKYQGEISLAEFEITVE